MDKPLEESATKEGILARLRRIVVAAVILALVGLTVFLLAERNSRFYFLGSENGTLVVSRGARLPWGKRPWAPEEPTLAEAYAPVQLPVGSAPLPLRRFDERQELDRALFDVLAGWADSRVRTDDPLAMQEGLVFVQRAGLLPGITPEQQVQLRKLRAEVAYFEGRERLEEGGRLLEEAREQLVLATEAKPARAREAVAILDELEPALDRLARALQMVRGLRDAIPAPAAAKAPPGALPHQAVPGNDAAAALEPAAPEADEARKPGKPARQAEGTPRGAAAAEAPAEPGPAEPEPVAAEESDPEAPTP